MTNVLLEATGLLKKVHGGGETGDKSADSPSVRLSKLKQAHDTVRQFESEGALMPLLFGAKREANELCKLYGYPLMFNDGGSATGGSAGGSGAGGSGAGGSGSGCSGASGSGAGGSGAGGSGAGSGRVNDGVRQQLSMHTLPAK